MIKHQLKKFLRDVQAMRQLQAGTRLFHVKEGWDGKVLFSMKHPSLSIFSKWFWIGLWGIIFGARIKKDNLEVPTNATSVLRELRKVLRVPEAENIITHAQKIMDEIDYCPYDRHFAPCGNHYKFESPCDWCVKKQ